MSAPVMAGARPLTWMHIGDPNLKQVSARNQRDLERIVAHAMALPPGSLDFVLLSGDHDVARGDLGVHPPADSFNLPETVADGSDRDSVGAWPEKGIVGGQRGPNRKGRTW